MAAGLASAPLAWVITDRLEADNRFCGSCHLDAATPLHEAKLDEIGARPAVNLVSLHTEAEPEFRCIDCHGGVSFANRLRVKTVAARDTALYVLGRFDEPEAMDHPLWDEDCVQCHASYEPERDDAFHAFPVHNDAFGYRCVQCHRAHPAGPPAQFYFLDRDVLLPICRNCHEEF